MIVSSNLNTFYTKLTAWFSGFVWNLRYTADLFFSLVSVTVLHGHVHCLRAVRGSLALLVRLLLEGSAADPVLDRRRHHPRHAGESCVLLRIPEHSLQRRLRLVDFIHFSICGFCVFSFLSFFFYSSLLHSWFYLCVLFPHSSGRCDFCWATLGSQKISGPNPGPHCQSWLRHSQVSSVF